MTPWKRYIPAILIGLAMAGVYFSGGFRYLSYETLRYHHVELTELINDHPVASPFVFMGVYAAATALSIPGGIFLSLIGGFLFRQPWATLYVLIGATTGATTLFLAARTALQDFLRKKAGPKLQKLEKGFQENAASYLLFLRLVPAFPFWLVNIAPAFFQVRALTYIWTTFVGIIAGAYVFTQAGRGLNTVFESSHELSIGSILNTQVKLALVGLALLVLLPAALKKFWKKTRDGHEETK